MLPEKIQEAKGDAAEHAARDFKVNPHYIADIFEEVTDEGTETPASPA